jgi:hypothetical protein
VKKKIITYCLLCLLLASVIGMQLVKVAKAEPKTIIVPNDYPTINQAIGNATAGDTILLRNGTYTEQTIQINQSLTFKSEYPNGATINLHPPQYMVHGWGGAEIWLYNYSVIIQASNVNLLGLTINGGGGDVEGTGDHIQLANDTSESKLYLTGNGNRIQNSSLAELTLTGSNCTVSDSSFGFILMGGDFNLLSDCDASIVELTGSENIVAGCSFIVSDRYSSPKVELMLLANANSNIIYNNTLVGGDRCIELNPLANENGASCNIFLGNRIEGAQLDGIWVWKNSSYNVFYSNLIANNNPPNAQGRTNLGNGISLGGSIDGVYNTLFFGNILKNNLHHFEAAHRDLGPVFFDNGTEGNYWDDYLTKCPNTTEIDHTGTGSVPYPVGGNSAGNICDNHPLINEPSVSIAIPALPEPWASVLPTTLLAQISSISTSNPSLPTTTVPALTDSGSTVNLEISGNITTAQMVNVTIASNQSATTTTISFTLTGQSGTAGFSNVTLPKNAIPYGTIPTIYIDKQIAQDQGYAQDNSNYYVWYTTHFSIHEVSIVLAAMISPSPSIPEFPAWSIVPVALATVLGISVIAVITVRRKRKPQQVCCVNISCLSTHQPD